jgi:hypothetical protein
MVGERLASVSWRQVMSSSNDISTLYREFTEALTEVLAENAVGPARPWTRGWGNPNDAYIELNL